MHVSSHSQILCMCMVLSCFLLYVWSYFHLLLSPIPFNAFSRFRTASSNTRYDLPVILMPSAQFTTFIDLCYIVSVLSILDDPFQCILQCQTRWASLVLVVFCGKSPSYCFVFPFCNLISLCSLGLDCLISLEFQALPLQEMCYLQMARLNSACRISSSGFYHHHLAMCSNHHKTQDPNIQTLSPMSFNVWMLGCCTLPDCFTAKYGGGVLNLYSNSISQLSEPGPLYKTVSKPNIQPCSVTTSVMSECELNKLVT